MWAAMVYEPTPYRLFYNDRDLFAAIDSAITVGEKLDSLRAEIKELREMIEGMKPRAREFKPSDFDVYNTTTDTLWMGTYTGGCRNLSNAEMMIIPD